MAITLPEEASTRQQEPGPVARGGCGGLSLPVPPSSHEVPEKDDRASVFQNHGVVLSGNRIAPPFIVDPPSLSNRHYPKSFSSLVKFGRQTFVVGANSNRGRGIQGPQPLRLEPTIEPVSDVVGWWSVGIHENRVRGLYRR